MNQYIIEFLLGLMSGMFLGITGIAPTGLILLALEYFHIGEYKKILGAILFINLFPISIGSVYEFYKEKQIDFRMGWVLLFSTIIGGYFGSKLALKNMSSQTIKYITSALGFIIGITFLLF